jgi:hypothetical protein
MMEKTKSKYLEELIYKYGQLVTRRNELIEEINEVANNIVTETRLCEFNDDDNKVKELLNEI